MNMSEEILITQVLEKVEKKIQDQLTQLIADRLVSEVMNKCQSRIEHFIAEKAHHYAEKLHQEMPM